MSPDARASLFTYLGVQATDHPRLLAALPHVDNYLDLWLYGNVPPSPALRARAGLLVRACRLHCGRDPNYEPKVPPPVHQPPQAALAPAPPPTDVSERKIKISSVADPLRAQEVAVMTQDQVAAACTRFEQKLGALPRPDEDVTIEQLTALAKIFGPQGEGLPYVDFSTWGPYGHRLQKKTRVQGVKIGSDGHIAPVDLMGPSTVEDWLSCYAVFRTAAIMLDLISPARLDAYKDFVVRQARTYGVLSWPILYQSEVRARLELAERLRREGQYQATTSDRHPFSASRPWEWVYNQLPMQHAFWQEELHQPALLALTRTSRLSSMLGGDAQVPTQQTTTALKRAAGDDPGAPRARPKAKSNAS
eukprot:3409888-Amphidinium_carterae.1